MALRREDLIQRALEGINAGRPQETVEPVAEPAPRALDDITQEELDAHFRARGLARTSQTGRAFNLGVAGVHSGAVAARGLARSALGGDGNADLERAVEIQQRAAAEGPDVQELGDIDSFGDAAAYVRNMVVQQVPNIATMVGTGGGLGLARAGVSSVARRAALGRVSREVASRQADRAAKGGVAREITREQQKAGRRVAKRALGTPPPAGDGAVRAGAALGGTMLQSGQMAEAALDDTQGGTDQERALKAAAGAVVTGAIESMPITGLLRRFGLAPAEEAAKAAFRGGLATRVAKAAGAQAGSESLTEVAQTVGELATHKWINDEVNMLDDDALSAYINAAVGGAIGGAVFGAPAGIRSGNPSDPRLREGLERGWNSLETKLRGAGARVGDAVRGNVDAGKEVVDDLGTRAQKAAKSGLETAHDLGMRADAGVQKVREAAGPAAASVKETFDKTMDGLKGMMTFNSSVMAGIDGQPYDFSVIDGEAVITGAPLETFVDKTRAREWRDALGLSQRHAMWASPFGSQAQVARFTEMGAFAAVQKAFTGWDTGKFTDEEKTALNAYRDALPDRQRTQLNRTLATFEAMAEKGVLERNEDGSLSQAYVFRPESTQGSRSQVDPQRAAEIAQEVERLSISPEQKQAELERRMVAAQASNAAVPVESADSEQRAAEQAEREAAGIFEAAPEVKQNVFKAARGDRPRTRSKDIQMFNDAGDRRVVNLGAAIQELRKDPAFVRGIRNLPAERRLEAEAATALSYLTEQGYQVDVNTISSGVALDAKAGWKLTPAAAMRLRAGLGDEQAINFMAQRGAQQPLRPRTRTTDPDVTDPGQADRMEMVDEVQPPQENQPFIERVPIRPGQGSPGTSQRVPAKRDLPRSSRGRAPDERLRAMSAADRARVGELAAQIKQFQETVDNPRRLPEIRERARAALDEAQREYNKLTRPPKLPKKEDPLSRPRASDTDVRRVDAGKVDRKALENERARERAEQDTPMPTGVAVSQRPRRIASQRNRQKAQVERARRNTQRVTAGAVERQQQIQDDAERGGSTERIREGRLSQEELGRAVGQALMNLTNSQAAQNLRAYTGTGSAGARSAVDFTAAIAKLAGSRAGVQTLRAELPKLRSRAALFEMSQVLGQLPPSPTVEAAQVAAYKRAGQLSEEIAASGQAQVQRMVEQERTIVRAQAKEQLEALDAALQKAKGYPAHLDSVMELLLPHFTNAEQLVVRALLKSGALEGVDLHVVPVASSMTGGYYRFDNSSVTLMVPPTESIGAVTNSPLSVLVHEAVHAATMKTEMTNPALRKDLNRLLNHVREHLGRQGVDVSTWYGLSETQEFLAEAFSNPLFQGLLEGVPPLGTGTFKNAWEQFKSWVRKALFLSSAAEVTALDEIFTIGHVMMREQGVLNLTRKTELFAPLTFGSATAANSSRRDPAAMLRFLDEGDRVRLLETLSRGDVKARIAKYVPKSKVHLLDTADVGPEMLLNWGVGLYLDGKLKLDARSRSAMGRMWEALRSFLQVPTKEVYARQILKDMKAGRVKKNYRADARILTPTALGATRWVQRKVVPVTDALLKSMNARIRGTGIPAMRELATLIAQRTGEFRSDRTNSLRQNWEQMRGQYMSSLERIIGGIDAENSEKLVRALQARKRPRGDLGKVYDSVRTYLDEMYDYMTEAGVKLGSKENYFPVVMDREALAMHRDEYFELHRELEPHVRERFRRWTQDKIDALPKADLTPAEKRELRRLNNVMDAIDKRDIDELIGELYDMAQYGARAHYMPGVDFTHTGHKPAFKHANHMTSDFIFEHGTLDQRRRFAEFQSTNIGAVLAGYTNRSTRRAEWERLGLTERIDGLMQKARNQGATAKHIKMMQDYVNMEMGTYNDTWNPVVYRVMKGIDRMFDTKLAETDFQKARGVMGALQVYNNVRLLPLALLSSLVDPIAGMVRSGTMKGALTNMRDALRALRDSDDVDSLRKMAESMGVIEREGMSDLMATLYGNIYAPGSTAAKVNAMVFRFNGMDTMLRFSRLTALAAGHRFLIRHKTAPNEQSARYLKELGLTPSMIRVQKNGKFVVMSPEIEAALRRFVDEATVRPTPAQKPAWHNDPNFSLASQYKGYLYAFYETVMQRAALELGNGNPAVLAPLLMYVPITLMAEVARDVLQGDGDEKEADDYLIQSVERSGLLGPRIGVLSDGAKNVEYGNGVVGNLAGASGQQLADAYDVVVGDGRFASFFEEAMPGQALYKNWGDE